MVSGHRRITRGMFNMLVTFEDFIHISSIHLYKQTSTNRSLILRDLILMIVLVHLLLHTFHNSYIKCHFTSKDCDYNL